MCEICALASKPSADAAGRSVSRRSVVSGVLGLGAAVVLASPRTAAGRSGTSVSAPTIAPRSAWGADLPPRGPLEIERPGDVRFLLVHHTAGPNDYAPDAVPDTVRSIYQFHTSSEKGWPDVAYNFFVDRHGGIWEGRQGSIDSPVMGSATGGSQGYAMLCCFLGTHTEISPTPAAQSSMVALLAWLADRYDIDTRPGATAAFVSRGSNLHPVGTTVRTPTIAGHRDMSSTSCPGDAAYALVTGVFPQSVSDRRAASTTTTTASTPPPTTAAAATTVAPTTVSPITTPTTTSPPTTSPTTTTTIEAQDLAAAEAAEDDTSAPLVVAAIGAAAVAATAGALAIRRRTAVDHE